MPSAYFWGLGKSDPRPWTPDQERPWARAGDCHRGSRAGRAGRGNGVGIDSSWGENHVEARCDEYLGLRNSGPPKGIQRTAQLQRRAVLVVSWASYFASFVDF